jgi:hypothetical protein
MARRSLFIPMLLGVAVFVAACDDDETGPDAETFSANLTGGAERPNPVTTSATGGATFTVDGQTVDFTITVEDIDSATAAHIHGPADANTPAGVLVTLFAASPPVNVADGTLVTGTFPSAAYTIRDGVTLDSVLVLMRNGNAYVNVHTRANTGGEIRGQIVEN